MLKLSKYNINYIREKLILYSLIFIIAFTTPNNILAASFQLAQDKKIQVHGFASQAFIYTDNNNFFGNSADKGSFEFTELGVNFSFEAWHKFHIAAQLLSRRAGESDNGTIKVDFALADYRFIDSNLMSLGVRAGRIKNPFGIYNDTRDVPFTRSSIILPQSIYFDRTRDISISSDGIQLYGHRTFSVGIANIQLLAALPRVDETNTEIAVVGQIRPGNLNSKLSFVNRIGFENHNNTFRVRLSDALLNIEYNPTTTELGFSPGESTFQFHLTILSLQYNFKHWEFTGEIARREINVDNIVYIPPFLEETIGLSYYFQTAYHLNFRWKFLLRYDVLYQNKNDKDGSDYATQLAALGAIKPGHSRYSKDLTLGIQYDLNRSWMVRAEIHSVDGTAWLPVLDNEDIDNPIQKWRMATASVSYRF